MPAEAKDPWGTNVLVEFDEGIAWVSLNRPDKRNAMNPALAQEMFDTIDALEIDDRCGVVVLTGSGNAFSAGMDLKEFFRANDGKSPVEFARIRRVNATWQWRRLMYYPKPTIAMVNGWCFGGAFTPLVSCDLSIAAEEATFGLSEINWGIIPGGVVTQRGCGQDEPGRRALLHHDRRDVRRQEGRADGPGQRGRPARQAAGANARAGAGAAAEESDRAAHRQDRLPARQEHGLGSLRGLPQRQERPSSMATDPERGRQKGMSQFLDEKSYRPGLGAYRRDDT